MGLIRQIGLMSLIRRIRQIGLIRKMGRRHYLLMDGMHSCAYIPKWTYRYMNKLLVKSLEDEPKAENSLRFVWSRMGGRYVLAVNPDGVDMTSTHGLTRDTGGRILIPCPYIQQIYQTYGLEPEWCGRMYIDELRIKSEELRNKAGKLNGPNGSDRPNKPWLAIFAIYND